MKPPLHGYPNDDYNTPPEALIPLIPYLDKEWVIWECAAGRNYLVRALLDRGYMVRFSDPRYGNDFITSPPDYFDCIVTNPPFSLKTEFIKRAIDLGRPFAFLLPITTLETGKRQEIFREHDIRLILFDSRIDFIKQGINEKGRSWFASAWFTHGLNLPKELNFVSIKKLAQQMV